jgi:hypothetical protein
MHRVFKSKSFNRWANDEQIPDEVWCQAAAEIAAGQVEADLGGYLFKKRIARAGGGKSGGYRTIVGFKKAGSERIIFIYAFAKSDKGTITPKEKDALTLVAKEYLSVAEPQLGELLELGSLVEVRCE